MQKNRMSHVNATKNFACAKNRMCDKSHVRILQPCEQSSTLSHAAASLCFRRCDVCCDALLSSVLRCEAQSLRLLVVEDSGLLQSLCDGMHDDPAAKAVRPQIQQRLIERMKKQENNQPENTCSPLSNHIPASRLHRDVA